MTELPNGHDIENRVLMLPEEASTDSDDPKTQARVILGGSLERTEHPERARHESTQTPG